MNYLANFQSAFLAPTEILAIQHYENIQNILPQKTGFVNIHYHVFLHIEKSFFDSRRAIANLRLI